MLMLYDGAIRFISLGIQAIENGLIDKRAYYINKTSAIVSEFAATLDHNQDAKLAEDLDALYGYMLQSDDGSQSEKRCGAPDRGEKTIVRPAGHLGAGH